MSFLDKLAGLFALRPLGSIREEHPHLVRPPLSDAVLGGGAALFLLSAGLLGVWWFGTPGRWVARGLLTWLCFDYLGTAWRLRPEPEADVGMAGGLLDAPLRWNDEGNTMLAALLVLLFPGKWLATRALGLLLYRWLPTAEELAERLLNTDDRARTDRTTAARALDAAASGKRDREFAADLRRSRLGAAKIVGMAVVAGGLGWVGVARGSSEAGAIAALIAVELIVRMLRRQANSFTLAHPDLLHLWVTRHRPELEEQGKQVVQIQVVLASVLLRMLLAVGLALFVSAPRAWSPSCSLPTLSAREHIHE